MSLDRASFKNDIIAKLEKLKAELSIKIGEGSCLRSEDPSLTAQIYAAETGRIKGYKEAIALIQDFYKSLQKENKSDD